MLLPPVLDSTVLRAAVPTCTIVAQLWIRLTCFVIFKKCTIAASAVHCPAMSTVSSSNLTAIHLKLVEPAGIPRELTAISEKSTTVASSHMIARK